MNIQQKQRDVELTQIRSIPVDKIGDKAVTHIAAALFFAAILLASAAVIQLTVREYWQDIIAALRGEVPTRSAARPWAARRVTSRPRPVVTVRAAQPKQQRAAV